MGYSELNIEGGGIIMADAALIFKQEFLLGYNLKIAITVGEISTSSFEVFYRLSTVTADQPIDIAIVKTGIVCFDYNNKKVATLPEVFATKSVMA